MKNEREIRTVINTRDQQRQVLRAMRHAGSAVFSPDRTLNGWLGTGVNVAPQNIISSPLPVNDVQSALIAEEPIMLPRTVEAVTLGMYAPEDRTKLIPLLNSFIGEATLNAFVLISDKEKLAEREAIRKAKYLATHAEIAEDIYDKERTIQLQETRSRLKQRINTHVYEEVRKGLGLVTLEESAEAFEQERQTANNAVRGHVALVYANDVRIELQNEVSLRQRPADLLELALSTKNPLLRFELQRQLLDTVIALRHEKGRSMAADDKLTQIQTLLNEKFYTGEAGSAAQVAVYGLFDNATNELADGYPTFESPTLDSPSGKHYKELQFPVRELQTGEQVLTLIGTKDRSAAIRKALRKAQERADKGQDDTVLVEKEVQDTHRMKIVVLGDQTDADRVANEVFELLTDRENHEYFYNRDVLGGMTCDEFGQPTGVPTGRGEVRTDNRGGAGQKKVNWTKILIEFDGVTNPIEVVIQPLASFITEELEVGTYDPAIGEFSGPAHKLYGGQRELMNKVYIPQKIYPTVVHPYENGRDSIPPVLSRQANELLDSKQIVIEERRTA